MDKILVKVINDGKAIERAPSIIEVPGARIRNPNESVLNKFGYWPLREETDTAPDIPEGHRLFDDGYVYVELENGQKEVVHKWATLKIVESDEPELTENKEIVTDEWVRTETEYKHIIEVVDVIDVKPILEEGQIIIDSHWELDMTARTKTRVYTVLNVVDNPPELAEGEEVVDLWSEVEGENYVRHYKVMKVVNKTPEPPEGMTCVSTTFIDDAETNTRTYEHEYRYVVDNEPVLEENQYIKGEWWEDDGETRTHVYDVWTKIDELPILEEGQQIIDQTVEVDYDTKIERVIYTVRYVIDHEPPTIAENEFIFSDFWNDDGETREHMYDVWKLLDESRPEESETYRIVELGVVDDPATKTRGLKYLVKPIIDNKPEPSSDNVRVVFDYEQDTGTEIIIHYKEVARVFRRISKMALEYALFQLGKMDAYNAWIDSQVITNELGQKVSLRHFYDLAVELAEDHALFRPYINGIVSVLGISEADADALINKCLA